MNFIMTLRKDGSGMKNQTLHHLDSGQTCSALASALKSSRDPETARYIEDTTRLDSESVLDYCRMNGLIFNN